jgi:hypothetical protein
MLPDPELDKPELVEEPEEEEYVNISGSQHLLRR